jgi:formylmethanofuran dehydrogenase subunit A
MKKIIYLFIMLMAMQMAKAQNNIITGNVNDEQGNPISAVFIMQGQTTNATFTDSVGNFSIKVNPGGVLKFDAPGYADNITPVDQANTNFKITLKPLGKWRNHDGARP